MNDLDYNAVLRDFQYKPNFAFRIRKDMDQTWFFVYMAVEDSRKPFEKWVLKSMPQDRSEDDLWYMDRFRPPPSNGIGYSPSREMTEVTGNYLIPPVFMEGDEKAFLSWVVTTVRAIEDHEIFEWLRYKGELLNDPHKEG